LGRSLTPLLIEPCAPVTALLFTPHCTNRLWSSFVRFRVSTSHLATLFLTRSRSRSSLAPLLLSSGALLVPLLLALPAPLQPA
jgi:hypothetical protein